MTNEELIAFLKERIESKESWSKSFEGLVEGDEIDFELASYKSNLAVLKIKEKETSIVNRDQSTENDGYNSALYHVRQSIHQNWGVTND